MRRLSVFSAWLGLCVWTPDARTATPFHNLDTYERNIRELEKTPGEMTVERILSRADKRLLRQFVLMTSTGSQHMTDATAGKKEQDVKYPRVILFNVDVRKDGSPELFLMAYSTHPEDPRYWLVELQQTDGDDFSTTFKKHLLRKEADRAPGIHAPEEAECATCHHGNPRWDGVYPFWPGAVGRHDDISPPDWSYLRNARKTLAQNARLAPVDFEALNAMIPEPGDHSPAGDLNDAFSYFQNYRIPYLVSKTPDFERFKFALAASLFGCGPVTAYVPEATGMGGASRWNELRTDTETKIKEDFERLREQFFKESEGYLEWEDKPSLPGNYAPDDGDSRKAYEHFAPTFELAANLRFLLETRGVDVSHWPLGTLRYHFGLRENAIPGDWAMHLVLRDEELRALVEGAITKAKVESYRKTLEQDAKKYGIRTMSITTFPDTERQAICAALLPKSMTALTGYVFRALPHAATKSPHNP